MKKIIIFLLLFTGGWISAQNLQKHSISTAGGSGSSTDYYMVYALGELGVVENTNGGIHLSEGFIGPDMYEIIMGVEDYETLSGVKIFPNPVHENMQISLPYSADYEVVIYDLTGKEVMRHTFEKATSVKLRLTQLHEGTYIAGVIDRQNRKYAALKFVKL